MQRHGRHRNLMARRRAGVPGHARGEHPQQRDDQHDPPGNEARIAQPGDRAAEHCRGAGDGEQGTPTGGQVRRPHQQVRPGQRGDRAAVAVGGAEGDPEQREHQPGAPDDDERPVRPAAHPVRLGCADGEEQADEREPDAGDARDVRARAGQTGAEQGGERRARQRAGEHGRHHRGGEREHRPQRRRQAGGRAGGRPVHTSLPSRPRLSRGGPAAARRPRRPPPG